MEEKHQHIIAIILITIIASIMYTSTDYNPVKNIEMKEVVVYETDGGAGMIINFYQKDNAMVNEPNATLKIYFPSGNFVTYECEPVVENSNVSYVAPLYYDDSEYYYDEILDLIEFNVTSILLEISFDTIKREFNQTIDYV